MKFDTMSTRSSKKGDPVAGALAAASAVTYIENRNKQSFPALRTIIFVGLLGLVLCVSLLYLADPSLTTEYAGHAADMVNDFKGELQQRSSGCVLDTEINSCLSSL